MAARSLNAVAFLRAIAVHARTRVRAWRHARCERSAAARRERLGSAPVLAVTGSAAKTTTAKLLAHLLGGPPRVGLSSYANTAQDAFGQITALGPSMDAVVVEASEFPAGNLRHIARILRPTAAVLTITGLDHYVAFRGAAAVAGEMATMARVVPADGFVIVNADDAELGRALTGIAAPLVTFGRHPDAEYRIMDASSGPNHTLVVTVMHRDTAIRLETPFLGHHFSVPAMAAAAAAHRLGVSWPVIQERLACFTPVFGRCTMHAVPNGPRFICDTSKAPAWSFQASVETLDAFIDAPRRTLVLGTLSDYPGSSRGAYRKAWRHARTRADRTVFLRHSPSHLGATTDDIQAGRAVFLPTAEQIAGFLRSTAIPGEVILLKGSCPADHLDRIAHDFVAPVRCWLDRCGRGMNCIHCEWIRDATPIRLRPLMALRHKLARRPRIYG